MPFCEKCGKEIGEDVKFCPNCGAETAKTENTTENEQPKTENNTDFSEKIAALNNTADSTSSFTKEDIEKNKVMAVLAYLIFLIPLLAAKDSPYARYHTNQGLILFIVAVISSVIAVIPILGWIVAPIISIIVTILAIIGIVNAATGKAKELPIIGKFKLIN